ncbi:MAG: translocation/assembly module TamB domain-containing protein, partial [Pseudomonadota bacterium]
MMSKWIKLFVVSLIVLFATTIALAWALLGTSWGTHRLMSFVTDKLPPAMSIRSVDGSALGGLTLVGFVWEEDGVRVSVDRIQATVRFMPLLTGTVSLSQLSGDGVDVTVTPQPESSAPQTKFEPLPVDIVLSYGVIRDIEILFDSYPQTIDKLEIQVALQGDFLRVDQLDVYGPNLTLKTVAQSKLSKPFKGQGQVNWRFSTQTAAYAGVGSWAGDSSSFEVVHNFQTPWSVVTAGNVSLNNESLELIHSFDQLDFPLTKEQPIVLAGGSLETSGEWQAISIALQTTVSGPYLSTSNLNLLAELSGSRLDLTKMLLTGEQGSIDGVSELSWDQQLAWEGSFNGTNIDLSNIEQGLDGVFDFSLNTHGVVTDDQELDVTVSLQELVGELSDLPLTGSGDLVWRKNNLVVDGLLLESGNNSIAASGELQKSLDLSVALEDLSQLHQESSGSVRGTVSVQGRLEDVNLTSDVQIKDLSFGETRVTAAELKSLEGSDGLRLNMKDARIGGVDFDELRLNAKGNVDDHELDFVVTQDIVSIDGAIVGAYGDSIWQGSLRNSTFRFSPSQIWTTRAPIPLSISNQRQEVERFCFVGPDQAEMCGFLRNRVESEEFQGEIQADRFPIFSLIGFFSPGVAGNGSVSGNAQMSRLSGGIQGEMSFRSENGQLLLSDGETGNVPVDFDLTLTGEVVNNELSSNGLLDLSDVGRVDTAIGLGNVTSGQAPLTGFVKTQLKDVSLLELFLPSVDIQQGELTGDIRLAGTLLEPTISGNVMLQNGVAQIESSGSMLSDIQVSVSPETTGRYRVSGSAQSDEGDLAIAGVLKNNPSWIADLTVTSNNFPLIKLPDFQLYSNLDLEVSASTSSVRVAGNVLVPRANISLESLPESAVSPSQDTIVHTVDAQETEVFQYDVEVSVVVEDGFHLNGFGLDTDLQGDLNLRANNQATTGVGTLSLINGTFGIYGQVLKISRGTLSFTGPLSNPILDLRATRQVDDNTVGVQITGT